MSEPQIALLLDLVLDLKKDISTIKDDTVRNTTNLEAHMKRTDQNEVLIQMQNKRITKLENHDKLMNSLWKISLTLVGLTGTVLGIIAAIRGLL